MKNHSEYVALFRDISSKHVLLLHSENWKEGEGKMHFARIIRSATNPFDAMADIKEFIENYKDDLRFPCLLLETRLLNLQNKSAIEHQYNCSFFILDGTGEVNDFTSQELTITRTEQIALDVLGYLKELSKANQGIYFDENGAQVDAVATITDNIMGVRADFNLKVTRTACYDSSRFDGEAYDACDWFFRNLSAAQTNCVNSKYIFESNFVADVVSSVEGETITFTTDYDNADLYFWEFGDGDYSYLQNPSHVYGQASVYTVKLTIVHNGKLSQVLKVNYITVVEPDLDVDLLAFLTASGITDETIIDGLIDFVATLKITNIWNKMKAIYPFVGGTSSSHKWNLKDPRDLNEAYRLTFFNSWSHSSNGAKGAPNVNNTYIQTYLNAQTAIPSGLISFGSYRGQALPVGIGMGVENYSIYEWPEEYQVAISGAANVLRHLNGMGQVTKISSTEVKYTRNNIVDTISGSFGALPNSQFNIGGILAGYGVSWLFKFAYISEALTSSQTQELYAAVHQLQIALNRQES